MGILFGRSKAANQAKVVSNNEDDYFRAVLGLKRCRDNLMKYQKRLEEENERLVSKAREFVADGKLEKARIILKTKKIKEEMLSRSYKMLENVETQIADVENKKLEIEYINEIASSNDVLKAMIEAMPVDEVERIMDENEEQSDRLKEVSDLLGRQLQDANIEVGEEDYEAFLIEMGLKDSAPIGENPVASTEEEIVDDEEPERVAVLA